MTMRPDDSLEDLDGQLDALEDLPSFQYETVTKILTIIARVLIVIARQM